jgi:diketogulonate reductase-like aldo/keto reductase
MGRMLSSTVPATGEAVPAIGLGTWPAFDVGAERPARARLAEVLAAFVGLGGRVVDTSPMYGRAEEVIGELTAAAGLRPRLFVATKVWTSGRAAGQRQMEESERRLRARPIDLLQVHNLLDVETHLDTLTGWKREGRVRYVGITHYSASAHEAVARVLGSRPVDFLQINYSVGEREAERRLLPMATEHGIAVIANRPFAAGGLLRRLRTKPLPVWASEIDCESWPQLLLKFVVSHPAITCAIPATSNVAHLRDNMKAGEGRMPDGSLRPRIAAVAG